MPDVSVVMGIRNGGATLAATLDSVLSQDGVAIELIAVDDGSEDDTADVLDRYAARDPRVRVLGRPHAGLTLALIAGCDAARGDLIARQDVGDVSLPGRLAAQVRLLSGRPEAVMVSCATRYLGPRGELLYESRQQEADLETGLDRLTVDGIRGPSHHGSVVFRRDAYREVGGYRSQFRFAQDLDLWLRLREVGGCLASPELGYQATWSPGGISSRHGATQRRLCGLAIEAAKRRRRGEDEAPVLARARRESERSAAWPPVERLVRARTLYFVGSCLMQRDPARARGYFIKALRAWPLHGRSFLRLLWPS